MNKTELPDMQSVTGCPKCGGDRNAPGFPATRFRIQFVATASGESLLITCPCCGWEVRTKTFEASKANEPADGPDLDPGCPKCKNKTAAANCGGCGRDMRL